MELSARDSHYPYFKSCTTWPSGQPVKCDRSRNTPDILSSFHSSSFASFSLLIFFFFFLKNISRDEEEMFRARKHRIIRNKKYFFARNN